MRSTHHARAQHPGLRRIYDIIYSAVLGSQAGVQPRGAAEYDKWIFRAGRRQYVPSGSSCAIATAAGSGETRSSVDVLAALAFLLLAAWLPSEVPSDAARIRAHLVDQKLADLGR